MKISVPIMMGTLFDYERESLLKKLEQLDADELIISFMDYDRDLLSDFTSSIKLLKESSAYFESQNIKTSVWIATLSFFKKPNYVPLTSIDGREYDWMCPICDEFANDFCAFVKEIAKTGVRKIVLEDDFRMQIAENPAACFCDKHMQLYSEKLGESVTREKMREMVFSRGMNKYRRVWMDANREALNGLARKVRVAVDEVDPTIGFRLCCGPTLFGGDGSDPFELVDIFEGSSGIREVRLIGGPYWTAAKSISAPMDFERMQISECKKRNIVAVVEDDPYPRPRYACSAYRSEFYHTVALADGRFDGVQKYAVDYVSSFDYENGYAKRSAESREIYREIHRMFSDKECRGVHLIDSLDYINHAEELPVAVEKRVMYSAGRKFLSDISMPVVFEAGGVNVIFGENARCIDREWLKNGSVLDIKAAKILAEAGIDVGLVSAREIAPVYSPFAAKYNREIYHEYKNKVGIYDRIASLYDLQLAEGARELSRLFVMNSDTVGSYCYENASGERFLVYGFEMDSAVKLSGLIRNYLRQKQFVDMHEWLNGQKLPAVCLGNPDLYLMTKLGADSMAIGLWNNCEDETMQRVIELHQSYRAARFVNCEGELRGDKIILTKPIGAYSYGFIELKS